jgi:hypothetical protein
MHAHTQARVDTLLAEEHVRSLHLGQVRGELSAAQSELDRQRQRAAQLDQQCVTLQVGMEGKENDYTGCLGDLMACSHARGDTGRGDEGPGVMCYRAAH